MLSSHPAATSVRSRNGWSASGRRHSRQRTSAAILFARSSSASRPELASWNTPLDEYRRAGLVTREKPDRAATVPGDERVCLRSALGLREGELQDRGRAVRKRCRKDQRDSGRVERSAELERPLVGTLRREQRQSAQPVGATRLVTPPFEAPRQHERHRAASPAARRRGRASVRGPARSGAPARARF